MVAPAYHAISSTLKQADTINMLLLREHALTFLPLVGHASDLPDTTTAIACDKSTSSSLQLLFRSI